MAAALTIDSPVQLLTAEQAAEMLGIERQTLSVWRCTGRNNLRFVKVGRNIRYRMSDLMAWIEKNSATSSGELCR